VAGNARLDFAFPHRLCLDCIEAVLRPTIDIMDFRWLGQGSSVALESAQCGQSEQNAMISDLNDAGNWKPKPMTNERIFSLGGDRGWRAASLDPQR
jgi:hypothetical protein